MVHNSNREPEKLHFYCNATNVFNTTLSNNITVEFFSVGKLYKDVVMTMLLESAMGILSWWNGVGHSIIHYKMSYNLLHSFAYNA